MKVVVFDNATLGMVRQLQELYYHKRYSATDLPRIPDYVKLAEAYGWTGLAVDAPEQVRPALQALLDAEGPAILDVRMSRAELALPMAGEQKPLDQMIGVEDATAEEDGRRG